MSLIDAALKSNGVAAHNKGQERRPEPRLVIVTCMDPRVTGILQQLGLDNGDAHVIRNAGGAINEDSIRSLLVSTRVLGTREIMIISHTDCGMQRFTDHDLEQKLERITGATAIAPSRFYSFVDLEENTRKQVRKVKSHPWIDRGIPVRGFIYDVSTGRLQEVIGTGVTTAG